MTRFIDNGIEVPGIPKLYLWPDGGWRPEEPSDSEKVKHELIEAIRLTQDYAQLPALPGWTWYDALKKHAPDVLDSMSEVSKPTSLIDNGPTPPKELEVPESRRNFWCAGTCAQPIEPNEPCIFHSRLNAYVHATDQCMANVYGEDVRHDTVRMMADGPVELVESVARQSEKSLREKLRAATKPIPLAGGDIRGRLHFDDAEIIFREHFDSRKDTILDLYSVVRKGGIDAQGFFQALRCLVTDEQQGDEE